MQAFNIAREASNWPTRISLTSSSIAISTLAHVARFRQGRGSGVAYALTCRFPQLNRIAFRVTQASKAAVWIGLGVHFDSDSSGAELRDHCVQVANSKVYHPGLLGRS